ncbi:RadC family protein [Pedobacter chitinilyticus]|uniref:DNA repair protein RadC n=1 Tax=Pedobacter chitinilyticus TaxID=2233776 RepID=A0A3S3PHM8_9SPHI|nr:DNA repair protein RadC [Pedobacter chitinilyticus]RWU08466.1 DNA repair protein RadC [Pedobacter chitinilyticus]
MSNYENKLGIKAWAEADRPREKLLQQGRRQLTDAELIAILIGSGNKNETAVDLSKRILSSCQNDLDKLSQLGVKELSRFKGIGEAKAISIVAALELGRRRNGTGAPEIQKILSSIDAFRIIKADLADLPHEEFWLLLLNRANVMIGKHFMSKGGQAGTVIDPKMVFKIAIEHGAASMVLVHNHPSGNLKPSNADVDITTKLVELGKLMEISIFDHIIVCNHNFLSMADEGYL